MPVMVATGTGTARGQSRCRVGRIGTRPPLASAGGSTSTPAPANTRTATTVRPGIVRNIRTSDCRGHNERHGSYDLRLTPSRAKPAHGDVWHLPASVTLKGRCHTSGGWRRPVRDALRRSVGVTDSGARRPRPSWCCCGRGCESPRPPGSPEPRRRGARWPPG